MRFRGVDLAGVARRNVTDFVRLKQRGVEQQTLAEALRTRAGKMEVEIYQRAQEIAEANRQLSAANQKRIFDRFERAVPARHYG